MKAATPLKQAVIIQAMISIHAAREGGDNSEIQFNAKVSDFNPRRP